MTCIISGQTFIRAVLLISEILLPKYLKTIVFWTLLKGKSISSEVNFATSLKLSKKVARNKFKLLGVVLSNFHPKLSKQNSWEEFFKVTCLLILLNIQIKPLLALTTTRAVLLGPIKENVRSIQITCCSIVNYLVVLVLLQLRHQQPQVSLRGCCLRIKQYIFLFCQEISALDHINILWAWSNDGFKKLRVSRTTS